MDCSKILYSEISFKPAILSSAPTIKDVYSASSTTTTTIQNKSITNGNTTTTTTTAASTANGQSQHQLQLQLQHEEFRVPKHQLCDPSVIKLDWSQSEKIGGGLINVGNTCFLNSVLQCLTYCPPLYNFLLDNGGHSSTCKINQFCMLCEMEKHIKRVKNSNGAPIKPVSIVQRLKYINKSFQFGRQEDAHEFLRYIIDHMWKACLMNLDINVKASKVDPRIKETTIINHIFGGYHRSQVLCLTCNSRSNTFDFFMDFILDIRHAKSLEDALKRFTQSETLENENAYKCGKCRKKVTAKKKFTVFKAPNVATFQLKRFDSDRIFGGKITKYISYPEEFDLRPYMSDTTKSSIKYQLSAVLVHVGHSSNSGHYFCFIRNSNGFWYRMDDSSVSLVKKETVLQQLAYVLLYTRKPSDSKIPSNGNMQQLNNTNTIKIMNGNNGNSSKQNDSHISNILKAPSPIPRTNNNLQFKVKKSINGTSSNKITDYLTPTHKSTSQTQNLSSNNTGANPSTKYESSIASPVKNQPSENSTIPTKNGSSSGVSLGSTLSTWFGGTKSKLDEEDTKKRKLNEMTDRDKFNEELDQGRIKKVKSRNRDERFSTFSKLNPFQRFASNGYQRYNNNNNGNNSNGNSKNQRDNAFQKHDGSFSNGQFQHSHNKSNNFRRFDFQKSKFRHGGKHKSRNFNRRP